MRVWMVLLIEILALCTAVVIGQADQTLVDPATKELLTAYLLQDQAAAKTVQARVDAMLKTPEGQAYQSALSERQKAQAVILAKVETKVPGYTLDFSSGALVPKPPAKPK